MTIKHSLLALFVAFAFIANGQRKQITLEDLNLFRPQTVDNAQPLPDGFHYTVIGENGRTIDKIEYATGKKIAELINLDKLEDCKLERIEGYAVNSLETRILFYLNKQDIYRHSFAADYYLYDIRYKELKPLTDKGKVRAAGFSPDGENVAYVHNYNIWLSKLRFNTESAITTDGKENAISNGIPDWVYEEEFAMDRAIEWSADSKEIAYIRWDQSAVKEFQFQLFQGSSPKMGQYALYPGAYTFKYPKAGEANALVSVQVFNISNRTTKTMNIGTETDMYVPRIKWTTQPGQLGVLKLNRHQNQLDLLLANSSSTLCNAIFTHRSEYYIGDDVYDNLTFLPDGSGFIYLGEMDGYNHIHLYSMAGRKISQITKGNYDVTAFLGYDAPAKLFYYQSAEHSPLMREIYACGIDGKNKKLLTPQEGTNNASFSTGCKYFINQYSSLQTPPNTAVFDSKGKQLRVIEANKDLSQELAQYNVAKKEFVKIPIEGNIELNGWVMKPLDFDPSKQYPLLIMQYSGPNSQQVLDKWGLGWEQYLASQGVVVASVDPRGTGARGEAFRKCTYLKLGQIESDDLATAATHLGQLPYVDAARMGIFGWSYGGYMTLMCMSRSDVFKAGIAVAPVTDWRFYDSVYTERFMRRPFENGTGYANSSPIQLAKNMNGKLLLIHGTADDNVHYQNTLEYVDKLVQEGKQFNMFVYPNRDHSIYGGNTRLHLNNMMSNFIKNNL
jgi:dipeptidyl-peptidase 4